MRPTVTFSGNYGSFTVDAESGVVVSHSPDRHEIDGSSGFGYLDVLRVDLAERRDWYRQRGVNLPEIQPDGDVCDVGAWCADGGYIAAPDDFREEVIRNRYPNAVPLNERPVIPTDWQDLTWREDINPQWHVPNAGVNVWIGRADPKDRPAEAPDRFTVTDATTGDDILLTDDWRGVLAIVAVRADLIKARAVMLQAATDLTSYLLDETEGGFEEIPDVDTARTSLFAFLDGRAV